MEIVRIPVWMCNSEEADQLPANWPVLVDTWGNDLTHARAGDAICKLDHSLIISYNDPSGDIDEAVMSDPFIRCTTNSGAYVTTMVDHGDSDIALDMLAKCVVSVATKDRKATAVGCIMEKLLSKVSKIYKDIQKGDLCQDIHRDHPYSDKDMAKDIIIYSERSSS